MAQETTKIFNGVETLKDLNLKEKRVLLRCDLDASFDREGNIIDDFRIKKIIPTIEYLLAHNARIILLGHLGRPWEEAAFPRGVALKRKYTLAPVGEYLSRILNRPVRFLEDCIGEQVEKEVASMKPKSIILLENVRFYREEKENNQEFAKRLAGLGEVFVNDAWSACCEEHASIVSIPRYLPSGAGFLLEKEIINLSKVTRQPERPLIVIIGGARLEPRIGIITKFLKTADHILIGGRIANIILAAKGISIGKFLINPELESMADKIELTNPKIHLPVDGMVSLDPIDNDYIHVAAVGKIRNEEECFDIGPGTIELFSGIIKTAKTVVWHGPLGFFEHEKFVKGSLAIAEGIVRNRNFSVAGGEETSTFLKNSGFREKFSHVSTGSEAMLEFLAGQDLPGLEALR